MNFPAPRDPLVFVDLETTGANFANDRIIEIGLVEVDADGVREWSSLVDPGRPVPPFITGLTGIDTRMVDGAPSFAQLAPALAERLRGRLFVAHNAQFDYGFLKHEFRRLGIDFRAPRLCTVKLSRKLFPGHARHSLDTLVARFGIATGDRHRALADACVLRDLWQCWHTLLSADTIWEAVDLVTGRPAWPPQLDASALDELPEAPGAYAFYGEDGALLRVRRAANLRQQVFAEFGPGKCDSSPARDTWRIDWREAAGEMGARLREIELGAPRQRAAEDLCAWQLLPQEDGGICPTLVFARDVDFAHTPELYGLYAHRREALQALRKLAEAHRLCPGVFGLGTTGPGEACVAWKQKSCRGACVGKEPLSLHSARLLAALAKHRIAPWPYAGPLALIERDEFGMREDAHVFDAWRYLGTARDDAEMAALLDATQARERRFDPDVYRLAAKHLREGRLKAIPCPTTPR